jgi:phosphatidylinositol alpha-1,6-mannosyltransferase
LRRLLNPLNDLIAPYAVRRADAVRTVSAETTRLVRERGVEPAGVFPAYVDFASLVDRPRVPLPERPRVIFIGSLAHVKGIDTLVAAWPAVRRRLPAANLRIVGDGHLRGLVGRLVSDDPGHVEWTPRVPAAAIGAEIDAAWVLAVPSRSEGLPRVALEAASRGRAIVGGRAGGIPDVVRDGENGYLVEPAAAGELAEALVRILADRELADALGASARRTGEAWSITPAEYAAKVEAVVAAVLAEA